MQRGVRENRTASGHHLRLKPNLDTTDPNSSYRRSLVQTAATSLAQTAAIGMTAGVFQPGRKIVGAPVSRRGRLCPRSINHMKLLDQNGWSQRTINEQESAPVM
eukprot:SAG11_NODE_26085_length_350_cov_0.605578_1_plen_103_part_01